MLKPLSKQKGQVFQLYWFPYRKTSFTYHHIEQSPKCHALVPRLTQAICQYFVSCFDNFVLCFNNFVSSFDNFGLCFNNFVLCIDNFVLCFTNIDLCFKNIVLCFKNCLLCLRLWATVHLKQKFELTFESTRFYLLIIKIWLSVSTWLHFF